MARRPLIQTPLRFTYNYFEAYEDNILYKMQKEISKQGKGRIVTAIRASKIVDLSSQYGNDESMSYTAFNILGPPSTFPEGGDNPYSYLMRTYGKWQEMLPSSLHSTLVLPKGIAVESQDFVEFCIDEHIFPFLLHVYEVYHPGAIVKVLCYCYDTERWVVIWKGAPQVPAPEESHCFTAVIEGINFKTDYFRIEFYHKHLDYFCEIDGIVLFGEVKSSSECIERNLELPKIGRNTCCTEDMCCEDDTNKASQNILSFDILPTEVIRIIFSYLDLQSLCIASRVSKLLQKICYDPVLYQELNLQLYWHLIDVNALKSLQPRLTSLRKLNIAWCGSRNRITSSYFIEFIESTGRKLTSLKLANCHFINDDCLKAIANNCEFLKELEMQSCRSNELTEIGFKFIAQITNLIYLDLHRTFIDKTSLICIIKSLKLEHLFLGGCFKLKGMDEVVKAICKYLKNTLRTLDLWRASDLTCTGILEIAEHCNNLVEVDIGWCHAVDASCGCVRQLIIHCPKLKKLFLTAIRTISNAEIEAIANHSPDLEQLDILGTNECNTEALKSLLQNCKKMKLLDISYPSDDVKMNVPVLRTLFPNVSIKCSKPRKAFIY